MRPFPAASGGNIARVQFLGDAIMASHAGPLQLADHGQLVCVWRATSCSLARPTTAASDRLGLPSRTPRANLAFIATLMEAGVEFVAVDNPHANKLTVHILAAVAQHEREMISERTIAALPSVAPPAQGHSRLGARCSLGSMRQSAGLSTGTWGYDPLSLYAAFTSSRVRAFTTTSQSVTEPFLYCKLYYTIS
jgi:Resolvase, N terminal domain